MIDLDDLERKASAALAARAIQPKGVVTHECAEASWAHQVATEPPVTLALIARIRELEGGLEDAIDYRSLPGREILRALLEKGIP